MTNKDYVNYIWHFKVEDNLDWEFCAGYMKMNEYADVSAEELEYILKNILKIIWELSHIVNVQSVGMNYYQGKVDMVIL